MIAKRIFLSPIVIHGNVKNVSTFLFQSPPLPIWRTSGGHPYHGLPTIKSIIIELKWRIEDIGVNGQTKQDYKNTYTMPLDDFIPNAAGFIIDLCRTKELR